MMSLYDRVLEAIVVVIIIIGAHSGKPLTGHVTSHVNGCSVSIIIILCRYVRFVILVPGWPHATYKHILAALNFKL